MWKWTQSKQVFHLLWVALDLMSAQYNAAQYGPTPSWRYLDHFGMDTGFFVICNFWNSSYFGDVAPTTFKRPVQLRHEPSQLPCKEVFWHYIVFLLIMEWPCIQDWTLLSPLASPGGLWPVSNSWSVYLSWPSKEYHTRDMFSVVWHMTTSLPTLFSTQWLVLC